MDERKRRRREAMMREEQAPPLPGDAGAVPGMMGAGGASPLMAGGASPSPTENVGAAAMSGVPAVQPIGAERGREITSGEWSDATFSARGNDAGVSPRIGAEQVREAMATLLKYKQGKAALDGQIVANEEWYKLRHWNELRKPRVDEQGRVMEDEVEPSSAWLFNAIANKHADAMDNFPRPNVLPREAGDVDEAKILSSILPPLLDQCGFEKTYSDEQYRKIKHGTGVYGVLWDPAASNGLGEITVQAVDVLNLFWEPGVTDIQDSQSLFVVKLWDIKVLEEAYPQLKNRLATNNSVVSQYIHDDAINTSDKAMVVDWYYKRSVNGKTVLHFCKFVDTEVLFATENDPQMATRGLYDHGKYPFVFDTLFPLEGTPAGFGYVAVGKSPQEYIDRGDQAVLENMLEGATPRYWASSAAGVNEAEFADRKKKIVHYEGDPKNIQPIDTKPLATVYVQVKENKVNELKEVTGNRDVSTGGTSGGVTAAAAIAAMQEAGGKLSRDMSKGSYRAFRGVMELIIELIRQFYTVPHYFRIVGEGGKEDFVRYTNAKLRPQVTGVDTSGAPTYRSPVFDIEISAEKQSPYSRLAQNEMALSFYQAGFFAPQNADAALNCIQMMDFERKDMVMQRIAQNGTLYRQLMAMQQTALVLAQGMDQMTGGQSNYTAQVAQTIQTMVQGQQGDGLSPQMLTRATNQQPKEKPTASGASESSTTKKARERAAQSTAV